MFKVTKTIIKTSKVNHNSRILVISDIHYSGKKDSKKLDKLYNYIKRYNLDYICIPGDILDYSDVYDKEILTSFIKRISSLAKVLLSLGNHDMQNYQEETVCDKGYYEMLNKMENVFFLDNSFKEFKELSFKGYTQSLDYYYSEKTENPRIMEKELEENNILKLSNSKFNILLMHSPICMDDKIINKKLSIYDLILCGHMHNGVIPPIIDEVFKGNRGLVAPNKRLFPKYARGVIKGKNTIVISSGVTKISSVAPRILRFLNIFFPIGINIIEIINNEKQAF